MTEAEMEGTLHPTFITFSPCNFNIKPKTRLALYPSQHLKDETLKTDCKTIALLEIIWRGEHTAKYVLRQQKSRQNKLEIKEVGFYCHCQMFTVH